MKNIYVVELILNIFITLAKTDITKLSHDKGYLLAYPKECSMIVEEFAQYASNFTMCSIQHAQPIRLCEKCIDQYVLFYKKYEELLNTTINGTSCKSIYVSHDRLDAVLEFYNSISSIWNKGNCNACFDWSENKPILANNTIHFNKMFQDTMDCISQNAIQGIKNNSGVCEQCLQLYDRLDEYYKSLSDSIGVDNTCMDIVDSMNATRSIWSKDLNCCQLRRSPEIIFLCCTAIISILPIMFYLAVRYCGPTRDLANVLRQTGFKQNILRSVNRSGDR